VISRERRIIQAPPLKVVKIPLSDWEMCGDLHPVALSFEVPVHRWRLKPLSMLSATSSLQASPKSIPEYPHRPVVHRKRPTAISIRGRRTHCDTVPLAGQRKVTSGNAGRWVLELDRGSMVPCVAWTSVVSSGFRRLRGLCCEFEDMINGRL
jgi:hypothetical protein